MRYILILLLLWTATASAIDSQLTVSDGSSNGPATHLLFPGSLLSFYRTNNQLWARVQSAGGAVTNVGFGLIGDGGNQSLSVNTNTMATREWVISRSSTPNPMTNSLDAGGYSVTNAGSFRTSGGDAFDPSPYTNQYDWAVIGHISAPSGWNGNGFAFGNSGQGDLAPSMVVNADRFFLGDALYSHPWLTVSSNGVEISGGNINNRAIGSLLATNGDGSRLTGITAAQVGALADSYQPTDQIARAAAALADSHAGTASNIAVTASNLAATAKNTAGSNSDAIAAIVLTNTAQGEFNAAQALTNADLQGRINSKLATNGDGSALSGVLHAADTNGFVKSAITNGLLTISGAADIYQIKGTYLTPADTNSLLRIDSAGALFAPITVTNINLVPYQLRSQANTNNASITVTNVNLSPYLLITTAANTYLPLSGTNGLLTISAAAATYQPAGNYLTPSSTNGFVTSSVTNGLQVAGEYVTASVTNGLLTITSAAAAYQPRGAYLVPSDTNGMVIAVGGGVLSKIGDTIYLNTNGWVFGTTGALTNASGPGMTVSNGMVFFSTNSFAFGTDWSANPSNAVLRNLIETNIGNIAGLVLTNTTQANINAAQAQTNNNVQAQLSGKQTTNAALVKLSQNDGGNLSNVNAATLNNLPSSAFLTNGQVTSVNVPERHLYANSGFLRGSSTAVNIAPFGELVTLSDTNSAIEWPYVVQWGQFTTNVWLNIGLNGIDPRGTNSTTTVELSFAANTGATNLPTYSTMLTQAVVNGSVPTWIYTSYWLTNWLPGTVGNIRVRYLSGATNAFNAVLFQQPLLSQGVGSPVMQTIANTNLPAGVVAQVGPTNWVVGTNIDFGVSYAYPTNVVGGTANVYARIPLGTLTGSAAVTLSGGGCVVPAGRWFISAGVTTSNALSSGTVFLSSIFTNGSVFTEGYSIPSGAAQPIRSSVHTVMEIVSGVVTVDLYAVTGAGVFTNNLMPHQTYFRIGRLP